jgi:hypothetical protein
MNNYKFCDEKILVMNGWLILGNNGAGNPAPFEGGLLY